MPPFTVYEVDAAVSWAPDFWGQYRRASEGARAQILATEWGRRAVLTSLVSQVASDFEADIPEPLFALFDAIDTALPALSDAVSLRYFFHSGTIHRLAGFEARPTYEI